MYEIATLIAAIGATVCAYVVMRAGEAFSSPNAVDTTKALATVAIVVALLAALVIGVTMKELTEAATELDAALRQFGA